MDYIQSTNTCMCISCVPCVCVKCLHMHLHYMCALTPTLVEHKDCRCICRHGMHTMGCILSTKLTSTKLEIVEKNASAYVDMHVWCACACACAHDAIVHVCMLVCMHVACVYGCMFTYVFTICVHTIVKNVKRPDMQTTDKVCAQQTRTYNKDSNFFEK